MDVNVRVTQEKQRFGSRFTAKATITYTRLVSYVTDYGRTEEEAIENLLDKCDNHISEAQTTIDLYTAIRDAALAAKAKLEAELVENGSLEAEG
jgi:hypothetical protein